jgi:hypothetical protein
VIADVATDPNSGQVLEVGIGNVHEIYVVAPIPQADGSLALTLARGGIFSYYEFPSSERLTDEAWREQVKNNRTPPQPAFAASMCRRIAGSGVQQCGATCRVESIESLRPHRCDQAGQQIAHAADSHAGIAGADDARRAAWCSDNCAGAFQHDHCVEIHREHACCKKPVGLHFRDRRRKQACGFARIETLRFLRRSHQRAQLSVQAAVALMLNAQASASDREQREQHLADCLTALPPVARQLVEGYYFNEQPVDALARQQGRTVEGVYKLLQRTRRMLLECIQRKFAEVQA